MKTNYLDAASMKTENATFRKALIAGAVCCASVVLSAVLLAQTNVVGTNAPAALPGEEPSFSVLWQLVLAASAAVTAVIVYLKKFRKPKPPTPA